MINVKIENWLFEVPAQMINFTKNNGVTSMEKIFHPVTGEIGYFATEQEKKLINAIISEYSANHNIVHPTNMGGCL